MEGRPVVPGQDSDKNSEYLRNDAAFEKQQLELRSAQDIAEDGHVGTDRFGHALVAEDVKASAALRRKIDLRLMPIILACYLFCFIDRSNIGNARVAGLEADLKILPTQYGGYGYNLLLTGFYIAYVVFEPIGNFVCKAVGPGKYLPALVFGFGISSFGVAFCHNFGAAFACRFLLGIFEAGFFPGVAYYLSRWYTKDEFGFRMAMFLFGVPLSGAFGGLLASGFLDAEGFGMIRTWRVIFFAEGLITMGLSVAMYFLLPDGPAEAKWLKPEERAMVIARIKAENVGSMLLIDDVKAGVVKQAILNPTTLCMALYFCLANIPVQGLGFFLPSILRQIYPSITTIEVQLRTVPPYVCAAFVLLSVGYLSWKTQRRGLYMAILTPLLSIGYAIFLGTNNGSARYAATFLIAMGSSPTGALANTWATINTTSDTARAATLSMVIFAGNCGGLAATWTYIPKLTKPIPKESQIPGNALNLAGGMVQCFLSIGLWYWQVRENKQKAAGRDDYILEGKTDQEASILGQKHPGFRYKY